MVKHDGHTSVGLVGMQWFMQVLTNEGRADVAYTVASQTTRPSWGYMVSKGATTSWERWDTDTQDGGMNGESQKILSGNFEAWLYQTLGGINYDPARPGFKHSILRPWPVGDLTFVRSAHQFAVRPHRQRLENRPGRVRVDGHGAAEHDRDGLRAVDRRRRRDRGGQARRPGGGGEVRAGRARLRRLLRRLGDVRVPLSRLEAGRPEMTARGRSHRVPPRFLRKYTLRTIPFNSA